MNESAAPTSPPAHAPGRPWNTPRNRWLAVGLAATLLAGGAFTFVQSQDGASSAVEIWITDLPADFSRLDVRVSGVFVGAQEHPLVLTRANFDLLSLRGPSAAIKLAEGMVPGTGHDQVRIVFERAQTELDRKTIDVAIPKAALAVHHDFGIGSADRRALLFDIDVEDSLVIDGPRIEFRPFVKAVYIHAFGSMRGFPDASPGAPENASAESPADEGYPDFARADAETPRSQALEQPSPKTEPRQPFAENSPRPSPTPKPSASQTPPSSASGGNGSGNSSNDPTERILPDPGESNSAPDDYAETIYGWIVQFAPESDSPESMANSVERHGGEIVTRFVSSPAAYILATPAQAEQIYYDANVTYVEPERYAPTLLSTSKDALRMAEVLSSPTLRDPAGNPLDGRGIGVAVIDSGIDGLHPDLAHRLLEGAAAPVQLNLKFESIFAVDAIYTDTTSGHGTHVAGIVAGQGKRDPSMRGMAPGAKLIGLGVGELSTTLWTNQALDWVAVNHATTNPRIKVVTNSWGSGTVYDPNSLTTRLVNQLVAVGIVVVFAAGNDAGDGTSPKTTSQCQIPTPGVICVAAYDELNSGSRTGKMASYSSRGKDADPATWPDVSAPGTWIRSARTPFGWVTGVGLLDYYVELQGTSMAAPHVAGLAALMLQANPSLTPAQVESAIKATAHKYADGGPYYASGSHPVKGYGLTDAVAAIEAVRP